MRKRFAIFLTMMFAAVAFGGDAPPASAPKPPDMGEIALAERLAQMAQGSLAGSAISDPKLKEAAALLEAACTLNPYEPRFPRLRAEACLSLRDTEGAIAGLKAYTNLDPGDQVAQAQLIDLYAARMEAADAQIHYYKGLLGQEKLSPEVKTHVGVRLARLLLDRGDEKGAKQTLDDALRLSALNPEGLEMNAELNAEGTARERVNALLGLLRGNAAQPAVAAKLADELAEQGLTADAIAWYTNSLTLANRMGLGSPPGIFMEYLSAMLIGEQLKNLEGPIDAVIEKDPANGHALYLKMLLARRGEDKEAITRATDKARDGFLEGLYGAYRVAAGGNDPPTTQPAGELKTRTGDVAAQAAKVKEGGNEEAIADFADALTNLAWLEIYFLQTPDNAKPLIDALKTLVNEEDPRFARLEGWSQLVQKKPEEAQVKLSAVADRDPLSAMGIIQLAALDEAKKEEVKSSAATLLNENPTGLLGAILLDGLRQYGVAVEPSKDGKEMQEELNGFPKDWFTILDKPEKFYAIACVPLKVPHHYDEPMLAAVTITNLSGFDISIGPKGALRPDLWFDVSVRGPGAPQNLAGVAYDRLGKRLVLKSGGTLQQIVRLDQPKLSQGLAMNPAVDFALLFQLVTNPMTGTAAGVAPGPGGQRVQVKKPIQRLPSPLTPKNQQALQAAIAPGQPGDIRLRTLSLLGGYAGAMLKSDNEDVKKKGQEMADALVTLTADPSPPIATWARFVQLSLRSPETRGDIVRAMSVSDYWPQRLMASVVALAGGESGKELLTTLAEDKEPMVKAFAAAALDDLANPTTQPTTEPSTTAPSAPIPALTPSTQPIDAQKFGL